MLVKGDSDFSVLLLPGRGGFAPMSWWICSHVVVCRFGFRLRVGGKVIDGHE